MVTNTIDDSKASTSAVNFGTFGEVSDKARSLTDEDLEKIAKQDMATDFKVRFCYRKVLYKKCLLSDKEARG